MPKFKPYPINPHLPLTHEQRYHNQRLEEWAIQVSAIPHGTPYHLVKAYKRAFDKLTEAGRTMARHQDELDAKAKSEGSEDLKSPATRNMG